jgi:UDP-N-acetylglucosamine--N-acetylmuramyl-(pentapeptide) pyrophosphoryl-undecaprenol N-acetylglucosamine transferase
VLIAAGGTAGHVVPALAVAAELSDRGAVVEFAGGDRIEARLVPEAGYPLHTFEVRGFERRLSPALATSAWKAATAPVACRRIISRVRPDVVFGAGGYVSGPMLLAARASHVPGALLEVDAHMGLANRLAAPLVERVYLSFPIDGRTGARYLVTGRPIPGEPEAFRSEAIAWQPDVLVMGGSLGSTRMNQAAGAWSGEALPFRVLHITGEREFPQYEAGGSGVYQVRSYIDPLYWALQRVKLVVARAGGSIFEIAAAGKPSILVPSPNVTADHQTANARHLEAAGAAVVIPDAELTHDRLDAEVRRLLADPDRLGSMGEAALAWARPDAAAVIADDLLTLHKR